MIMMFQRTGESMPCGWIVRIDIPRERDQHEEVPASFSGPESSKYSVAGGLGLS